MLQIITLSHLKFIFSSKEVNKIQYEVKSIASTVRFYNEKKAPNILHKTGCRHTAKHATITRSYIAVFLLVIKLER